MKKIILILFSIFSFVGLVKGEELHDSILREKYLSNEYIVMKSSQVKHYTTMAILKRSSDGAFVYCIEPQETIIKGKDVLGFNNNYASYTNMDSETWKRVELLAYYGYGYGNHTDESWYTVTQMLIWQTVAKDLDIYYTDVLNGKKITKYQNESNELNNLVNSHLVLPNIPNNITINNMENIVLNDSNNVLNNYELITKDNKVYIDNNNLVLNNIKSNTIVHLERKGNIYGEVPIVYIDNESQNTLRRGNISTIDFDINIVPNFAKLKIIKVDSQNDTQLNVAGIKFKIFNITKNEYVKNGILSYFETNEFGTIKTDILEKGKYYIEEVDNHTGGLITNKEKYYFEIGENTNYLKDTDGTNLLLIKFKNDIVKGHIKIIKIGEEIKYENDKYYYNEISLSNVKFKLYASDDIYNINRELLYKKGEKVGSYITDKDGYIAIDDLDLGSYCLLEETSSKDNLVDSSPNCFTLNDPKTDKDAYLEFIVHNYLPKGTFQLSKEDLVTSKPIPNAKIAIYKIDGTKVFEGYTSKDGHIIINNLPVGDYYYKELEAPFGYILNDAKMEFSINVDSITKSILTNELIKVPDTKESSFLPFLIALLFSSIYIYEKIHN